MSCPAELKGFLPAPAASLPFRSFLVASETDPYLQTDLAARLAQLWQAQVVNVGRQGHINVASGHGPWPKGEQLPSALWRR